MRVGIADDELRVMEITPHDYRRMAELLTTYSSLRLQAVDACVIALAERLDLQETLRHFPSALDRAASDALIDRIEAGFDERGYGLRALEVAGSGQLSAAARTACPGRPGFGLAHLGVAVVGQREYLGHVAQQPARRGSGRPAAGPGSRAWPGAAGAGEAAGRRDRAVDGRRT